ncbi:MAG: glycosyltransferase [Brevirhabdus sp.]
MSKKPTILFIHQNFPAQFQKIAIYLQSQGWDVLYATAHNAVERNKITKLPGDIRGVGYEPPREPSDTISRYLRSMETAVVNGQGFAQTAIKMRNSGYTPDIVVAHSGWGSGSFAKVVWPEAKFVQYLEWWYSFPARDVVEPTPPELVEDRHANALCRNLPFMLDAMSSDAILVPTAYQAEDIPAMLRNRVAVMHDGTDCDFFAPGDVGPIPGLEGKIPEGAPVLTYATRGMEPMRGFPEFMAALEKVQATHPDVHTVIAGEDTIHYDAKLPDGDTYKTRALATHSYDLSRLHFTGRLGLEQYRDLLRLSDCHTYLTRPFVLSWSAIESMGVGCPMVVSDCEPVREALPDASMARHVDHHDVDALADAIRWMLDHPEKARAMGDTARQRALKEYDAAAIFPRKASYFERLVRGD